MRVLHAAELSRLRVAHTLELESVQREAQAKTEERLRALRLRLYVSETRLKAQHGQQCHLAAPTGLLRKRPEPLGAPLSFLRRAWAARQEQPVCESSPHVHVTMSHAPACRFSPRLASTGRRSRTHWCNTSTQPASCSLRQGGYSRQANCIRRRAEQSGCDLQSGVCLFGSV